jgi:hypothetical protein
VGGGRQLAGDARASARAQTSGGCDRAAVPGWVFGSVALLYVLYHLPEPARALAEAQRVVRPGGLVAVAVPSRYDSPELAHALPATPLTFDAELAPAMLGELFAEVEVDGWDAPLLELPDREAVRDYLVGRRVAPDRAACGALRSIRITCCRRGCGPFLAQTRSIDTEFTSVLDVWDPLTSARLIHVCTRLLSPGVRAARFGCAVRSQP